MCNILQLMPQYSAKFGANRLIISCMIYFAIKKRANIQLAITFLWLDRFQIRGGYRLCLTYITNSQS